MTVKIETSGPVTTIILNSPKRRNAIDREMAEALTRAFQAFEADVKSHVAVLYGAHGSFCAGVDLKAVSKGVGQNRIHPTGHSPLGPARMRLSKPVIAAIEGYAVAGGLELAVWCDLRVAAEDCTFGVFSRRWGVPLLDGGTVRLPRLIGQSRAMDMILTGRAVRGLEAEQWGLINRLVPSGQARPEAEELARQMAAYPQLCLRGDRQSMLEQWDLPVQEAILNEFKHGLEALEREAVAGARRFVSGAGRHGIADGPYAPKTISDTQDDA